jgi:eukaryotic-like serine/threonine-protein kinase
MPSSGTEQLEGVSEFLELLRAVGLLNDQQFQKAILTLPPDPGDAKQVAAILVSTNFLTPFQATRLLHGKRDGYSLGPYVLQEQLSVGRTGRTYKAIHRTMSRTVALKVLASEVTKTEESLHHFYQAARASAKLIHPNVVTVLDVNQIGKRLYIVLEYVDGAGADTIVKQSGPFPVGQALEFVRQVSLGLQHAHEHNIVHGVIQPGCLLIGRPGGYKHSPNTPERLSAKLTNFGLRGPANLESADNTETDPIDYRAPESFFQGSVPTREADIYALGCVLVYCLTGNPPFPVPGVVGKVKAHQFNPPPELGLFRSDIHPAVSNLITRMLAKLPEHRPTAAEVASHLLPHSDSDDPTARIDFNLPSNNTQPLSMNTSFLSGLTSHSARILIESRPELGIDDTSPWNNLNQPTVDGTEPITPLAVKSRPSETEKPITSLTLLVIAVAITICTATFLGIFFAIRHFIR